MSRIIAIFVAVLAVGPSLATAQALAQVARAEEARRKTVSKTSKVYTNGDLKADVTTPSAPVAPPPSMTGGIDTSSATPAVVAPDSSAPTPAASNAAASTTRDQAYWSARMSAARAALRRTKLFGEALQSRINGLTTDFVNRDDPAQRTVIEQDRMKAVSELDRVKKDIEDQTKAIADIEEEARRAGVPPGWLR